MTPLPGSRVLTDGFTIEVVDTPSSVAMRGANWIAELLIQAKANLAPCVIGVSGGSSPWALFRRLVGTPSVDWEHVHIVQADDRIAPLGHPDRNWTTILEVFGGVVPDSHLHPMPVEEQDLDAGCAQYARLIDSLTGGRGPCLVHLGLGTDGHTASLFPNDSILEESNRTIAVTGQSHQGRRRMSMTYRGLAQAHRLLWQVQGSGKADVLARLVAADPSIPAGRVRRDTALAIVDAAAMGTDAD